MQAAPKVAMSDDFLKSLLKVGKKEQQGVMEFVAKFRQNPRATGINYEVIRDAADANMRSVRINKEIRGIVLKPDSGDVYCLLWVDRHDDAYQWARRHKVSIHPDKGSMQVYAVQPNDLGKRTGADSSSGGIDLSAQPSSSSPRDVQQPGTTQVAVEAGLFSKLKDREIRRLGVPDDCLALVREVRTEDELMALQKESRLPSDALDALVMYAAGEPYEKLIEEQEAPEHVDTEDYAQALERSASRRHFVVLTEDSDLEALLNAPLERWRVFLHPSQRKLVERDWNGPVKVTGGAGTGKTVVAMHRAVRLASQYANLPGKPVVFTTFTKTLAEDIRHNLAKLCTPLQMEKILVVNVDSWALSILHRFGYRNQLLYSEDQRNKLWKDAHEALNADLQSEFDPSFLRAEYERVVMPQNCQSAEDYMRARRVGRGGQLGRLQRKALWVAFAEYRALLAQNRLCEPEDAFRDACALIRQADEKSARAGVPTEAGGLGIRCMVVDEAQDISAAAFELIRAAVPQNENDLFLVGDAHQRIYRHKVVLSKVGINVRGRSRSLKVNYRTTDEIRQWAVAVLKGCEIDDLDGETDNLRGYHSLTHGDAPEERTSSSTQEDVNSIQQILDDARDKGIEPRNICIVGRTQGDLKMTREALEGRQVECLMLDADTSDDDSRPGVRLATMHRVKGLEFDVVIIVGYEGPAKYAERIGRKADAGVLSDIESAERCLLHVAATRAKRQLVVLKRQGA